MEGGLSKRDVREDRIEGRVTHAVQVVVARAGGANLRGSTLDHISTLHAWQLAIDGAQLIDAMRADVISLEEERVAQFALESEIPTLCVGRSELRLELIVQRQSENDRNQFIAVKCERTGLLCRYTRNIFTGIEDSARKA